MNNPRLVRVKDKLGYFRGWEQSDSQTSQTYGIVEFENQIACYIPETNDWYLEFPEEITITY